MSHASYSPSDEMARQRLPSEDPDLPPPPSPDELPNLSSYHNLGSGGGVGGGGGGSGGGGGGSGGEDPKSRRTSNVTGPQRKISVAIMDALHGISGPAERKISNALGLTKPMDEIQQYNLLENEETRQREEYDESEFEESDDEDDGRYYRGDPLDDDVIDEEDIEAREVCCGEARLNCGRFSRQMKKEYEELREYSSRCDCQKFLRGYFSMEFLRRRLPILKWLPKYRMPEFQGDLVAGITVGLTIIPQSIAYAVIAGVPPQNGLYSAFIGPLIYIVLGSSKDMALGPSAISALLTQTFASSPLGITDATPAILMAFFCGFVYLALAFLGLGFLTDYFSVPVMKAFTVAAAITIGCTQIKKWFGLEGVSSNFMLQFNQTINRIPKVRLWDFLLGVICIVIIVTLQKLKAMKWKTRFSKLPLRWKIVHKTLWYLGTGKNIIAIVLASVAAYLFLQNGQIPFSLTGYIPPGIPPFQLPAMTLYNPAQNVTYDITYFANEMSIGFIIVPVLGILEALSIGNVFARRFNYRIDVNQELFVYGIGNVLTGCVGGYPVTGTFSRTAVNGQSGVKTPLGGLYTGIIVLISLQFLTPLFYYIPTASLAVVIFMAVLDMITFQKFWIFWRTSKIDIIPWALTIVLSFVINIAYGVLIGAAVSILLLLYPATRPRIKKLKHDAHTLLNCSHVNTDGSVILVTFNCGLMYPAIEYMKDKIIPISATAELPKGVILDFQHVSHADTTIVQGIRLLLENFNKKGISVVICQMNKSVDTIFTKTKIKYFVKTKTIEEATALIYGLKANIATNLQNASILSTSCTGLAETCPWVPRPQKKKTRKRRTGIENPGFVIEDEDQNQNRFLEGQGHYTNNVRGGGQGIVEEGQGKSQAVEVDGSLVRTLVQMEANRMAQIPEGGYMSPEVISAENRRKESTASHHHNHQHGGPDDKDEDYRRSKSQV